MTLYFLAAALESMKVHHCVQKVIVSERFFPVGCIANRANPYTNRPCQQFWSFLILLHGKRPTKVQTVPDVSAARKKSVRLNPLVCHTLSESGATYVVTAQARPSQNGRKTRHGSLGRVR